MASTERIILFKSPASDAYAQALLTIMGLPPSTRHKLTTYRSVWVPSDISEKPETLKGKKAILVCVDIFGNQLKATYPLRELTVVGSKRIGQHLELVVETGGYIECPDYDTYLSELRKSHSVLPPQEHSFIVSDDLRDLNVVPSEDAEKSIGAWQNLVEVVSTIQTLHRAAFFCTSQIKEKPSDKGVLTRVLGKDRCDVASRCYELKEYSNYEMELSCMLPRHTERDGLDLLDLKMQFPDWVKGEETLQASGRFQRSNVNFKTKAAPHDRYGGSISIAPKESGIRSPRLEIYFDVRNTVSGRTRRWIPRILMLASPFVFAYCQLLSSMKKYPNLGDIASFPPDVIGAIGSTIGTIILTAALLKVMGKKE